MQNPTAGWNIHAKLYEGYEQIRNLDDNFEQEEPLYRVETLAWLIASLIDMDELTEEEKVFYNEKIFNAVECAESILKT